MPPGDDLEQAAINKPTQIETKLETVSVVMNLKLAN